MRRPDDVEIMREALCGRLFEQGSVKVVRYDSGIDRKVSCQIEQDAHSAA